MTGREYFVYENFVGKLASLKLNYIVSSNAMMTLFN